LVQNDQNEPCEGFLYGIQIEDGLKCILLAMMSVDIGDSVTEMLTQKI